MIVGHENYHQLSECTDWPLDSLDAELHGVVSQLEGVVAANEGKRVSVAEVW